MKSNGPFVARPFYRRSFWQRLIGCQPAENALIELVNQVATAPRAANVSLRVPELLKSRYGFDVRLRFSKDLERLHGNFIRHCLSDDEFSADEQDDVEHLRRLFGISEARHAAIRLEAATDFYRSLVREVVADGATTDDERVWLEAAATTLDIPAVVRKTVYAEEAKTVMQARVDGAVADGMLAPEEDAGISRMAGGLGVTVTSDNKTQAAMVKMRRMWRIRHGELDIVDAGINLQRGERCHLAKRVEWHETRRQRVAVGYSGPTMRVKIAQGVYWRAGVLGVQPMTRDALVKIDEGMVYLTNKRLLFMGAMKNSSLKLDRILDFTRYTDGVGVEKDSGKSPVLIFADEIEMFCATLARLISDGASG